MVKSYCVKQKKITECIPDSARLVQLKNGRFMMKCKCAECGITKTQFVKHTGKRISPPKGAGLLDTVASTGADLLIHHGIPWLGKKAVEMGRYYGSEALRNPKLQKKALDYALDKLNPMIQNVGSQALDQLSTKIRPKKNYKTNRKNLDGGSLDIHNAILKIAPKKGFVMPGHHYTGPGNPLDEQLKYDPKTGQILEIYDKPTGRTDAVSMQHDVDYSVCGNKPKSDQIKCKNEADRQMVKALDSIPWKERQWGHTVARNAIAAKAKLGLGVKKQGKSKNVKSR